MPVVLVVEDEEPLQEIVRDALKEGGFNLTMVASGREAVAMIESGVVKYSALVADVNLKGSMKGWEIGRLVRQIDPAFPIVYMTGAAADDWPSEGVPNSILLKKTVRASAACDCCSAIAQCRRSQRLGVALQIGALWANARERPLRSISDLCARNRNVRSAPDNRHE